MGSAPQDDESWQALNELEQELSGQSAQLLPLAEAQLPLALPVAPSDPPGLATPPLSASSLTLQRPCAAATPPAQPSCWVQQPFASAAAAPQPTSTAAVAPQGQLVARVLSPGEQAIVAEAWSQLALLENDTRRQHMHWVQNRTKNPNDKQPEEFTREGFFDHLCLCYKEAYPEPAHRHGSIVMFGGVAKEPHAEKSDDGIRFEHHHGILYCSKRHAWKKVADLSYRKWKVKMHAAAHSGYATMHEYITSNSSKKPRSELDAEVWLSVDHPRGDVLRRLLEAGAVHSRAVGVRNSKRGGNAIADGDDSGSKRFRAGDMYALVVAAGYTTALEVQDKAFDLASKGDCGLAEFCTIVGEEKLEDLVRSAVAITTAPKELALKGSSRMELLRMAARTGVCKCGGVWAPGAVKVLEHQGEDISRFCQDVCRALDLGAKRGTNMAIIGEPGCGKSMVFEPLDEILTVMGKPDSKSTFPLAGVLTAHALVWQEYKHKDSIVLFEDLLAVLCGERLEIRVPHKKNVSHRNSAPMFYSSNSMLLVRRDDPVEMQRLNSAMSERFCTRTWTKPIPYEDRILDFPRCGRCCANFYLTCR